MVGLVLVVLRPAFRAASYSLAHFRHLSMTERRSGIGAKRTYHLVPTGCPPLTLRWTLTTPPPSVASALLRASLGMPVASAVFSVPICRPARRPWPFWPMWTPSRARSKKVLVRADLNVPPDVSFSPIYLFSPPWFGTLASNVSSWTPKECRIFWGDGTSTSMLERTTMLGIMPSGKR